MLANIRRDCVKVGKAAIELVNGDCVSVLDALQPRSVDVIVTSPPYNLGIDYEVYDDTISREEYLAWSHRWLLAARRVLSPQGSLFLNMGGKPKSPLGPEQVLMKAVEAGFVLQNKIAWVKSISVRVKTKKEFVEEVAEKAGLDKAATKALVKAFAEIEGEDGVIRTIGHFKSLNSDRFVNDCVEMIYHLTREGDVDLAKRAVGVPYEDKSNIARWEATDGMDLRCRGNAWVFDDPQAPVRRSWCLSDTMSHEDARWLALFLDTEGSIHVNRNANEGRGQGPSHALACDFTNTHEGLVREAQRLLGGIGSFCSVEPSGRSKRVCHRLTLTGKVAASILPTLYPHLIVKRRQAALGLYLEALKSPTNTPGWKTPLSDSDFALRERIWETMKQLNDVDWASVDTSWVPDPVLVEPDDAAWHIPYATITNRQKDRPHPATFPIELAERCYRLHGLERIKITMDPFSGLGNAAIAAARLGLSHVGIELGPKTHDEAVRRVREEAAACTTR
jgi:DNA modification methylase